MFQLKRIPPSQKEAEAEAGAEAGAAAAAAAAAAATSRDDAAVSASTGADDGVAPDTRSWANEEAGRDDSMDLWLIHKKASLSGPPGGGDQVRLRVISTATRVVTELNDVPSG